MWSTILDIIFLLQHVGVYSKPGQHVANMSPNNVGPTVGPV